MSIKPSSSRRGSKVRDGIFHQRILPEDKCVKFSSDEGIRLFKQALQQGHMECYFKLAEQFNTQDEPAFCALGTLSMVLNALGIDPMRAWKGVWRWYSDWMLDCCKKLAIVKKQGMDFKTFQCLARCNGAHVRAVHAPETCTKEFVDTIREEIKTLTARRDGKEYFVATYSRAVLNQTGDGHYSPIGGYNADDDMVLVFDVARFKYPPHWVKLQLLAEAMCTKDSESGATRGYATLSKSEKVSVLDLSGKGRVLIPTIPPAAISDLAEKLQKTLEEIKPKTRCMDVCSSEGDVFCIYTGVTTWLKACHATQHPVLEHLLIATCTDTADKLFLELLPNAGPAFAVYDHVVAAAHGVDVSGSYGDVSDHLPNLKDANQEFAEVFPLICGRSSTPSPSRDTSPASVGKTSTQGADPLENALKMTDTGELWIILLAVLPLGRQFIEEFGHQAFSKCFNGASAGLRQIKADLERLVACACGPNDTGCTPSSPSGKQHAGDPSTTAAYAARQDYLKPLPAFKKRCCDKDHCD